ncbi:SAM-dependent methyltransferase [Actinoplanes sp. NPDC051494]|uniref:SAM-dependent methyltransferase n=1 Tax=Actinoplanes sp. NPDC051494 TaxID=3363907 RepID=UPI003795F90A
MDKQTLRALAHADHPITAPVSEDKVRELLGRAVRGPGARLLDLGCGDGSWLLRTLQQQPGVTAVGVDLSEHGFDRTRAAAAELGVAERLELRREDVTGYRSAGPADVVLSVGASYAYGGLVPTLKAVREHLAEDGTLLLGDCFWEREPGPELRAMIEGDQPGYTDLAGTVDRLAADGWTPVYAHVSTLAEWDDYEWNWTGSLARWALDHPGHPDRRQVLDTAAEHRTAWLHGYRGVLGFVTLLLRR